MSHSLIFIQALLALVGLYGAAWLLLKAKEQAPPRSYLLAGILNAATASYLLCNIGMAESVDSTQLIKLEKASSGLAVAILGVLPWCLKQSGERFRQAPLLAHTALAGLLTIANSLATISLRYESLLRSDSTHEIVKTSSSLWSIPFNIVAFSTAAFLLRTAVKARHQKKSQTARLLAASAIACAAFPLAASLQESSRHPSDNFIWLALASIAVFSTLYSLTAKPREKAEGLAPKPPPLLQIPDNENDESPLQQHALLIGLADTDAELASKILGGQGYIVVTEDSGLEIPDSYFQQPRSHFSVFFDRDKNDQVPDALARLIHDSGSDASVIALAREPKSPRILRELRDQKYQLALKTPLRARELFQMINSQTLKTFRWTQAHHPHLS